MVIEYAIKVTYPYCSHKDYFHRDGWLKYWGRRGLDGMVVGFSATCAISAYHH
jgi:hypothetical protein